MADVAQVEHKVDGDLKPVRMTGTPQAVEEAKAQALAILEGDSTHGSGGGGGGHHGAPHLGGGGVSGAGGFGGGVAPGGGAGGFGAAVAGAGGEVSRQMECPSSIVGRIIGRGGETIRGLQNGSGAHINIDQVSTHPRT